MTPSPLPFELHIAQDHADILEACHVRGVAYGHHLPDMRPEFATPEALDLDPHTLVLLVRDRATGAALGTVRLRFSDDAPLQIEGSVDLPRHLAQHGRCEVTRLAVMAGADPRVRLALMKACYHHAMDRGVRWLVIGARRPGLIRLYHELGFRNVLPQGQMVRLAHAGDLPHAILAFDVRDALTRWTEDGHRHLSFMAHTHHPELTHGLPGTAATTAN